MLSTKDVKLLLYLLVIGSTIALLLGSISFDKWVMSQVIVLTYLAPSPLLDQKNKQD